MKDICLNCGTEYESMLWGVKCPCSVPNVIHRMPCTGCGEIIGYSMDDDYCGPEELYCPNCINKIKNNRKIT